MSELKEIQKAEEQLKLEKAQKSIRTVLLKEPFGLRLEQLTSLSRLSAKYAKEVLKTMDDIEVSEDGYWKIKGMTAAQLHSDPAPVAVEPKPMKVTIKPELVAAVEDNKQQTKVADLVLEQLHQAKDGIVRSELAQKLGLTDKQLANALCRLRNRHDIRAVGQGKDKKLVLIDGHLTITQAMTHVKPSTVDLFQQISGKVQETVVCKRQLQLSLEEIEKVLLDVFGFDELVWESQDRVVTLRSVKEVA